MSKWESDLIFRDCLERLEWEIQRLGSRGKEWAEAKQRRRTREDRTSKAERAFSFVFVAGALEDLFRNLNLSLASDFDHLEIRPHALRPAALSLLVPKAWEAMNSDRVSRLVRRRDLIETANSFYASTEPLELKDLSQLGLHDGRTVNIYHFEALWEGLCLSPSGEKVWLSPKHSQAVTSVADKRNAIAHFETDPRVEAFRFSYKDLEALALRVKETVERLHEHTIIWLDTHAVSAAV